MGWITSVADDVWQVWFLEGREGRWFFFVFVLLLLVGVERKNSDVLSESPESLVAVDGGICAEGG